MMSAAVISGIGEIPASRRSDRHASDLIADAVSTALRDAHITAGDIDAVVTESSVTPGFVPIAEFGPAIGLTNLRIHATSAPVGAGILQAFAIAYDMVASGAARHALTYFGIDWGTHSAGPSEYHESMPAKSLIEAPSGFAGPPVYFATVAKRYAHLSGLADDELHNALAEVATATRANGAAHPNAQLRKPLSRSDYNESPLVAEPLRRDDCALLSDGAVAIVISGRTHAANRSEDTIELAGWSWSQAPIDDPSLFSQGQLPDLPATRLSSQRAFAAAGITPANIDVAELYDCFSIAPLIQFEALGLCPQGGAREYVTGGSMRHDGARPTNTHGGLLSNGYLVGAGHIVEAIAQLRHEAHGRQVTDAQTALVGAGPGRQYTTLILRRFDA